MILVEFFRSRKHERRSAFKRERMKVFLVGKSVLVTIMRGVDAESAA